MDQPPRHGVASSCGPRRVRPQPPRLRGPRSSHRLRAEVHVRPVGRLAVDSGKQDAAAPTPQPPVLRVGKYITMLFLFIVVHPIHTSVIESFVN